MHNPLKNKTPTFCSVIAVLVMLNQERLALSYQCTLLLQQSLVFLNTGQNRRWAAINYSHCCHFVVFLLNLDSILFFKRFQLSSVCSLFHKAFQFLQSESLYFIEIQALAFFIDENSRNFSYLQYMNLPEGFYQITILIIAMGVLWALVVFFTKRGRNFRSSRNKRARKQFQKIGEYFC